MCPAQGRCRGMLLQASVSVTPDGWFTALACHRR